MRDLTVINGRRHIVKLKTFSYLLVSFVNILYFSVDEKKTKVKTTLDHSTITDTTAKTNIKEKKKGQVDDNSFEKKKRRKKKHKQMEKDKENSLPIAQSTLINSVIEDAQGEKRNKTLDISELPSATEDESSISSINTADLKESVMPTSKTVQHEETAKTKEMPEEKVCNMNVFFKKFNSYFYFNL